MVVSVQTLIDRSVKNMGAVHSVVKESAIEMIKRAYKEGIYVQISAGNRTYAQQNALYAQGRTKPGKIVTNARAGYSNHNFGLAIDYFLVSSDGKNSIWTVNKNWRRVAAIGKSLGFSWGGDWRTFKDYPHLEMTGGLSTSQLRAGKRPRLVSKVGNGTSVSKPVPTGTGNIDVDGYLGEATIAKLQKALGTPVDGKLSEPSMMVKELQKQLGVKVDGYLGKDTISALQKHLKTPVDGELSKPSLMVKELQKQLNAGTFKPGSSKPAAKPAASKPKANLDVDGYWGKELNKALQRYFGTSVDGVISKQHENSITKKIEKNAVTFGTTGSLVVKELQGLLGLDKDGNIGPDTIKALQKHLGTPVDGELSVPSLMVKELQKRLNAGKL